VIRRQNSWSYPSAIWHIVLWIDFRWHCRKNPSSPNLVVYRSILTEVESEDVLVITHGDDGLEYKNTRSCYYGVLCSKVGVLPQDAVVLFVAADNVWQFDRLAFGVVVPCIEVFDSA
jgi:hypothetical protein